MIAENPLALELRRMQMITEVGAEQNTTTIIMMPSEFVTMAEAVAQKLGMTMTSGAAKIGPHTIPPAAPAPAAPAAPAPAAPAAPVVPPAPEPPRTPPASPPAPGV